MLYDPKWEVNADPYPLEALIEWLEQQPAAMGYRWAAPSHCLLGQFVKSRGVSNEREIADKSMKLSYEKPFDDIALGFGPHTFGAALERARKMR